MIVASVGVGTGKDAYKAGVDACTQAFEGLPQKKADMVFVFGAIAYDQDKLISGISAIAQNALIVGCSTAGEITSDGLSSVDSVAILAVASDQMQFYGGAGHHIIWNAKHAGEECANALQYNSHGYATSCLVFTDILSGNSDLAIQGMQERLGNEFPIYGGASGDNLLFFECYEYLENRAYSGSVVAVGLGGTYTATGVAMHGFLPVGIERHVTRSDGTTLYELDGKPAISIYEDYFGEEHLPELHKGLLPSMAIPYPIGVFLPESNDVVLRTPIFVNKEGAITFTAAIPEGSEVRLMISDIDKGVEVAENAARQTMKQLNGKKPKAAIVINSISRKKMLGQRVDEEIRAIQNILGRDVPIAGYYGYAEIGGQIGRQISLHNGSILIWALAE